MFIGSWFNCVLPPSTSEPCFFDLHLLPYIQFLVQHTVLYILFYSSAKPALFAVLHLCILYCCVSGQCLQRACTIQLFFSLVPSAGECQKSLHAETLADSMLRRLSISLYGAEKGTLRGRNRSVVAVSKCAVSYCTKALGWAKFWGQSPGTSQQHCVFWPHRVVYSRQ